MVPKERPAQQVDSAASASGKNPKDPSTATKQQVLSIDFLTGMNNGIKFPDTTAGDFFAAFCTAANTTLSASHTKLKYVGIDGHVYELHAWNGMFTFSEVPKEKVALCSGIFVPENLGPQNVFRLTCAD